MVDPPPNSSPSSQPLPAELEFSWRMFLFWPCLLVAAAVYGAVSLAPAVRDHVRLRTEFGRRQAELVELDKETQRLERLIHGLEHDPQFRAEIQRRNLGLENSPGEVAVGPGLSFDPGATPRVTNEQMPVPWYSAWIDRLCQDRELRWRLLAGAAALCLFAFTALGEEPLFRWRRRQSGPWLPTRYQKPNN